MEEIVKEIMLYHRLGIVCLAGMILAVAVSVYSYQKMNMKNVLEYFGRKRRRYLTKSLLLVGIVMVCGRSIPAAASQIDGTTEEVEQPEEQPDDICPVLEVTYTDEKGQVLVLNEERNELLPYYNPAKEVTVEFKVTEEFPDEEKSFIKIISKDRKGNLLKEEEILLEEGYGQIVLKEDGHYRIESYLVDMMGNEMVYQNAFALDYTAPEKPVIRYKTENQGFLARVLKQLTFGYFAKEKITASILVEDAISGVKQVTYSYEDVDLKEVVTETFTEIEVAIEVELPLSFRGIISVAAEDHLGNKGDTFTDIGVIAEAEKTHEETMDAGVQVLTEYSKTPDYYAGDVEVKFSVKDAYSGIQKITYLAGNDMQETISYEEEAEIVTEEVTKEFKIAAAENQNNQVQIGLEFTDNAGHQVVLEEKELPKIHIDTIAPKIRVEYDNHDVINEKYYRESRKANVYIEERNFDPEDVDFDIDGPETKIAPWSHQMGKGCHGSDNPYDTGHADSCVWKTEVKFEDDGEYCFHISCTDLAGNQGHYEKTDEFVIDKTIPVIIVDYNNRDVKNEFYYKDSRIARITIREKNFDPEDVEIYLTAESKGQKIEVPNVSRWISEGENHQAIIHYDYDGIFSFDISYTDLAGNDGADYPEERFVIDLTAPQILIGKVEDKSANNGQVSPAIMITDTNYKLGSAWTEVIGWQNGLLNVEKIYENLSDGVVIRIQDFEYAKEWDDLYRLTTGAEDLAGNAAKVGIQFSVNRFGSVYTLDAMTEKLAGNQGTYYTDQEKRLVITETNVDSLVFREIICSLNGNLKTLREGVDYQVIESGEDISWKQYKYMINAENFKEEGHYTVTIYSEDRASNVSDNQSKGKSLSFAVDKSVPTISIYGIEADGRYKENQREIIVDTQDNLGVSELQVFLNEEVFVYDMKTLHEADGKIKLVIKGSNQWQTLKAVAKDCTGNEVITEEMTVLVTPNVLVQFYHHKPLFYGTLAFGGLGLAIFLHKILRFYLFNSSKS